MVVIQRHGGSALLLEDRLRGPRRERKEGGGVVRNIGCRMAVGGRVRVNCRVKPMGQTLPHGGWY